MLPMRCAARMIAALGEWNDERRQQGEPSLAIGIGLNYGLAVIGDVGSEHGLSFTVIGDTVNTANRLQGLTRTLHTAVVVAEALVSAVNSAPSPATMKLLAGLHDRGEQALRGRGGLVRVWTWGDPR